MFFSGVYSHSRSFHLGTPQEVVLSLLLLNILMHNWISSLPDIPGITITCYADDICAHCFTKQFLTSFSVAFSYCGIIVSPDKSRIFSCRPPQGLPNFTIGGTVISLCSQYLGSVCSDHASLPSKIHFL